MGRIDTLGQKKTKNVDHLKIYLYGESGVGKTFFLSTAPKPLFVLDVDEGIRTIRGVPGVTSESFSIPKDRTDISVIQRLIERVNELNVKCPYATVALDSSTYLATLIQNRIITIADRWSAVSPTSKDSAMRVQDWQSLAYDMQEIFDGLLSLPANVIVTGHNRISIDKDTKSVLYLVMSHSGQSFPQSAPGRFDEIYRLFVKPKRKGDNVRLIQTQSDGKWLAKSRINRWNEKAQQLEPIFDREEPANFSHLVEKAQKGE
jgi:hypothetical protein